MLVYVIGSEIEKTLLFYGDLDHQYWMQPITADVMREQAAAKVKKDQKDLKKYEETKEQVSNQDEDWENEQHQTENWEESLLVDLQAEIDK